MENIDEFMQQKFNSDDPSERFPFHEEYWEQAEALLAADEARRRKRRRVLFWWWTCGLLLLGSGGYMAWQWAGADNARLVGASRTPGATAADPKAAASVDATSTHTAHTTAQEKERIENQYRKAALDKAAAFDAPAITSSEMQSKSRQQDVATRTKKGQFRILDKGIKRENKDVSALKQLDPPSLAGTTTGLSTPVETAQKQPVTAAITTANPELVQSKNELPVPATQSPVDTSSLGAPIAPPGLQAVSPVPVTIPPLVYPNEHLVIPIFASSPPVRKTPPESRFVFGLTAAGTVYENSPLGGTAGIFMAHKLHDKWWLTAGAAWRYMPVTSNGALVQETSQLRYSFGYRSTQSLVETRAVQSIEIPVGLQWRQRYFAVEAGAAASFLGHIKAQQTQIYTASLQNAPIITIQDVSANRAGYRRVWVAPYLGATWQATPRLGLWLRGYYRPSSVALPGPDVTAQRTGYYFDLGVRCLLVKR